MLYCGCWPGGSCACVAACTQGYPGGAARRTYGLRPRFSWRYYSSFGYADYGGIGTRRPPAPARSYQSLYTASPNGPRNGYASRLPASENPLPIYRYDPPGAFSRVHYCRGETLPGLSPGDGCASGEVDGGGWVHTRRTLSRTGWLARGAGSADGRGRWPLLAGAQTRWI